MAERRPGATQGSQHLRALRPREVSGDADQEDALAHLGQYREMVAAWCERAITTAWDNGRLGYPATTQLPFEEEVFAILRQGSGRATAYLERARRRVADLEWAPGGAVSPSPRAPLARLAKEFDLSPLSAELVILIAAPSIWGDFARLYGIISNNPDRPLCDEALLCQLLLPQVTCYEVSRELDDGQPLLRHGFVRAGGGRRPFADLSIDPVVIEQLRGEPLGRAAGDEAAVTLRAQNRRLEELRVPPELLRDLLGTLAQARQGPLRLVVRGRSGSGRRTLFGCLAAQANRMLGIIDASLLADTSAGWTSRLGVLLQRVALRGWLPCVTGLEAVVLREPAVAGLLRSVFRCHPGPLLLRCEAKAHPPLDPGYECFDLPALSEGERVELWQGALSRRDLSPAPASWLAASYHVGPGTVERVVEQVALRSAAGAALAPEGLCAALEGALRQHREDQIGQVATRVGRLATWSSVVLPEDVIASIHEFISRLEHRRKVYETWGFDRLMTSSRGITALFQGGPGTGKSMVAGIIARELGFDLYRVDLSRILSKWIGETERNLARVFDAAEEGRVIILFDEADSLFARRTQVQSSVDRYANVEVNYLLQRLDSFEGVAILTTNFGTSIDEAFKRRLSFRLTFPFPDEEMRAELWRVHLPPELPTAGAFDLGALARRYELSGGYIRNCALRAAFLAAQEGGALTQEHLEYAIQLEYRELGKITEAGRLE